MPLIEGNGNSDALSNLKAVQAKADAQARRNRSPIATRKPYSLVPGGHQETVAWLANPNTPESLARLFAVRDEAARRKNARLVQGFNLTRTLPESSVEKTQPTPEEKNDVPCLPEFDKVSNGFVPLARLVAEEVSLTASAADDIGELPESAETERATSEMAGLGIFVDDNGESIESPDDDNASTISRWSSSSSDSDSSYSSSDSDDSFERWAGGDGQTADTAGKDTITAADPTPDSVLSEIDEFAQAWTANVARSRPTSAPSSSSRTTPQPPTQPAVPLIRRKGKYLYSTSAADRRFEYIKSYLSLREDAKPASILLLLIHYRPFAACAAARRNPAFLRAAQDIDWTGILDEMPVSRGDGRDHTRRYNRHVVKTWFQYGGGHVFAKTDRNGDIVVLIEDEDDAALTWPELVAREDLRKAEKEIRDCSVLERVFELDSVKASRRRRPQRPGRSNLAWTLTAPV